MFKILLYKRLNVNAKYELERNVGLYKQEIGFTLVLSKLFTKKSISQKIEHAIANLTPSNL